jgi:hypothetical protein
MIVIAVLGLVGAAPTRASATTRTRVLPATRTSSFTLRGSGRYYVEVSAKSSGHNPPDVSFEAVEERYKVERVSVAYSTGGRWLGDGGFAAKLPGLGRVAVRFTEERAHKAWDLACGGKPARLRKGEFSGTVSFRGERGFTTVHASSARGQVKETKHQICSETVNEPGTEELPPGPPYLRVAGSSTGGTVTFYAAGAPAPVPPASGAIGSDAFEATYAGHRHGLAIKASTSVDIGPAHIYVPGWPASLTEATVEPPRPFVGKGILHLESPTTSSWTGDLGIVFPGLGRVALTGPGVAAQLCEGLRCSGPALPPAF